MFSHWNVYDNMKMASFFHDNKLTKEMAIHYLKEVNLDSTVLYQKIASLSGGQVQRVSIALAMIKDADYIFLDEPTDSLDDENTKIISELLSKLRDQGKGIVIVTHHPECFIYDSLYHIEDGKINLIRQNNCEELDYISNQISSFHYNKAVFKWIQNNWIKSVIFIAIVGLLSGSCIETGIRWNGYNQNIYNELSQFSKNETLLFDKESINYGYYSQSNNPISSSDMKYIDSLNYVENSYPFYDFIGYGFFIDHTKENDLSYGVEIVQNSEVEYQNLTLSIYLLFLYSNFWV